MTAVGRLENVNAVVPIGSIGAYSAMAVITADQQTTDKLARFLEPTLQDFPVLVETDREPQIGA